MRTFRRQKGFTLVELLVAMAIFVMFSGVLFRSYVTIVQAQHEANEYRQLYSGAREVFEKVVYTLRENTVDYGYIEYHCQLPPEDEAMDTLILISKTAEERVELAFEEKVGLTLNRQSLEGVSSTAPFVPSGAGEVLNTGVSVDDFQMFVSPSQDPYHVDTPANERAQPKVVVKATFSKEVRKGKVLTVDLQTTVSSRIYNQPYAYDCP